MYKSLTKKLSNKKLWIVPAVIIVAGLIVAGVHAGSNNDNKTDKTVVAADHTTNNSNSGPTLGTDNSADNSAGNGSNSSSNPLGYNLNGGTKANNDIAKANTGTTGSTGDSGSTTPTTPTTPVVPPVTTPVNPPVTPVDTPGANLIGNPSAEDSTAGVPTGWTQDGYGTNTPVYTYLSTGHTGSHSLGVSMSAWTNGDAKWGFTPITVTPGTSYKFSDYYQSSVPTEVDADFVVNGVPTFLNLGTVPASAGWTQFNAEFTTPVGATSLVVYHILTNVGSLTTDDYSLTTYTPAQFTRGIVTINFDDGWLSQYTNAVPLLQADSLPATFFIITDSSITNPDPEYMNATQIIQLKNDGYEIGNHTETHPDLTTLAAAQVQTEMGGAESALQSAIGVTATDFAYPFGAYNASTIAIGQSVGFVSQRSVVSGFNTKDTLDLTQLKIEEVDADISTAQVQAWVDQAIAQHTWLILVYHEIDTVAPAGSGDEAYLTSPTNLQTELNYIKSTGVAVETTAQAVTEVTSQ